MGQLDMPIYCAPTALQRLFHHEGEGSSKSSYQVWHYVWILLATVTRGDWEESDRPKMFQFYFHKDRGLNDSLLERAKLQTLKLWL